MVIIIANRKKMCSINLKKGIGKGLMQELLNGNEQIPIHLTSTFGNEEFYKKLGCKKHKTALSKYPFITNYVEINF
jgi:aralkylamine N-acetyltransferase